MPSFYIDTFGCQMNVADSDMLAELLSARGYTQTSDSDSADLLIVNTCSVRARAEQRAKARISEYAAHKKNKGLNQAIWVVGCMAERMGERLAQQISGVDKVIGATRIEHISHDIDSFLGQVATINKGSDSASYGVSTFLPVMRGCDNYCSYCIVPYVRGREHSLPVDVLVDKVRRLASCGVKEITLLGQNVNSYHDGECDFSQLLRKLHDIDGIERFRFTTSHPKDCSDALIKTVANLPRLCSHFHLPVQSGSTRILGLMNRKYNRQDFLRLIDKIRRAIPGADITTDVMVGFPGETEEDYEQTLSLFEDVRFTAAFMFAYSTREQTAAAKLPGQIPAPAKKQRLQTLIALQTEITKEIYAQMVGKTVEALFTMKQEKHDGAWLGQDYGCKRVVLNCPDTLAGMILSVKIIGSSGMTLIAERS